MKPADVSSEFVVDVRTRPEYAEEHIPGSVHVPLHKVKQFRELLRDKQVVFVCRTGTRATKACKQVRGARVVEGGIQAWKHSGREVRGSSQEWSMQRQVRLIAGSLVLVGSALGFFVSAYWFLLAGFVGAGLLFAGVTDTCGMAKLLARAPWNSRLDAAIREEL